jgi:hypothetical protein
MMSNNSSSIFILRALITLFDQTQLEVEKKFVLASKSTSLLLSCIWALLESPPLVAPLTFLCAFATIFSFVYEIYARWTLFEMQKHSCSPYNFFYG